MAEGGRGILPGERERGGVRVGFNCGGRVTPLMVMLARASESNDLKCEGRQE